MNFELVDNNDYSSPAAGEGKTLVYSGACYLYGLVADNLSVATRFVQVFDSISEPSSGAAPLVQIRLGSAQQGSISKPLPLHRWLLKHGLYVASSTTSGSYTAGGANDLSLSVFWLSA